MNIKLSGKENIYEQIVNQYKRYIELNIIRYGEKMPSCRNLALELGINPNTVVRAYSILEQEGYIQILPKKGVYVSYQKSANDNIELIQIINELKLKGISYDELINIINKIYRR